MKKVRNIGMIAFAVAAMVVLSSGCRKKADTIAKIYVRNSANELVSGASVRLWANPTDGQYGVVDFEMKSTTSSAGVATFNFNEIYQLGQAGVVVADIEAVKDGSKGTGIIKVDQETTSEETVFL